MIKQPKGLISILLDVNAEFSERDDAAMDLCSFDEPEVEEALLKIVLDRDEYEILVDSAGESLREIWNRKGYFNNELVIKMHPSAKSYFTPSVN